MRPGKLSLAPELRASRQFSSTISLRIGPCQRQAVLAVFPDLKSGKAFRQGIAIHCAIRAAQFPKLTDCQHTTPHQRCSRGVITTGTIATRTIFLAPAPWFWTGA